MKVIDMVKAVVNHCLYLLFMYTFISSSGIMINAYVNGSLNIMRIELEKQNVKLDLVEEILRQDHKRFIFNPIKICVYKYEQIK